ncbi:MAG: copper chaperone PCu(A)C [Magnetococcus sp. DMHC-1]|nr:copper chaperone PCu(A)C [Magnetococcales bacterium]
MKISCRHLCTVLFMACCTLFAGEGISGESGLAVQGAWVREAPPSMQITAAYMILRNTSDQPMTLVGVTTPDFSKVEIHETVHENDQARMQAMKELLIPAQGRIALQPNGYHLMLINPKRNAPLRPGDSVNLILTFKDGKTLPVTATVQKGTSQSTSAPGHMQDMKHKQ